jgi:hypothetical protein
LSRGADSAYDAGVRRILPMLLTGAALAALETNARAAERWIDRGAAVTAA